MLEGKGKLLTKFRALKDKEPAPQRKQCICETLSVRPTTQRRDPCLLLSRSTAVLQRRVFLNENKIIRKKPREIRPQTAGWVDRMPAKGVRGPGPGFQHQQKSFGLVACTCNPSTGKADRKGPIRLTGQPNGQSVSSMFRDSPSLKS